MRCYDEEIMKSRDINEHRAWIDGYLKKVNSDLAEDPLWLGRFRVNRLHSHLDLFEDGSGGVLSVTVRLYDLKTKKYLDKSDNCLGISSRMFLWLNEFICEYLKVWDNEEPYKEKHDYRNVRRPMVNLGLSNLPMGSPHRF